MPDPEKVLAMLRRATELTRSTPGAVGHAVTLRSGEVDDVMVVGDLHGHVDVFAAALKLADLAKHPRRHLVVQELAHDTRIDPDEGEVDRSHRLIDVVAALKCQHPARVHYLMGNHELSELTGRSISKKGFALNALFRAGVEADYPGQGEAFAGAYGGLFAALPLMIRLPNRVMICHTVPDGRDLDAFDLAVLEQAELPAGAMARGGTVYALTWGRDTSEETAERFAAITDADLFVCGHQPCDEGFRQGSARQVIVDGTYPIPACVLVDARGPQTVGSLLGACHRIPMAALR
jgi:hypothetical protein